MPYGSMLYIPPTNFFLAAKRKPYQKKLISKQKIYGDFQKEIYS